MLSWSVLVKVAVKIAHVRVLFSMTSLFMGKKSELSTQLSAKKDGLR